MDTSGGKRPGGRSARVQAVVHQAVGVLLERGQQDTMTIPQVAELAGVNPTTIYRRWGSMAGLLEKVAVEVLTAEGPVPDTGSLSGDLHTWARSIAAELATTRRRTYLRSMVWAREQVVDVCPRWELRRGQVEIMVGRARERGEAAPGVSTVLDHVIAPLYHHAAFGMHVDEDWAADLVDDALALAR